MQLIEDPHYLDPEKSKNILVTQKELDEVLNTDSKKLKQLIYDCIVEHPWGQKLLLKGFIEAKLGDGVDRKIKGIGASTIVLHFANGQRCPLYIGTDYTEYLKDEWVWEEN